MTERRRSLSDAIASGRRLLGQLGEEVPPPRPSAESGRRRRGLVELSRPSDSPPSLEQLQQEEFPAQDLDWLSASARAQQPSGGDGWRDLSPEPTPGWLEPREADEEDEEVEQRLADGLAQPVGPVWSDVLDRARARERRRTHSGAVRTRRGTTGPASANPQEARAWPPAFRSNPQRTWGLWHNCPQNRQATLAARQVIDRPASAVNPLVLLGGSGAGKSHILWAIGDATRVRWPDREVLHVSTSTLDIEHQLPRGWEERLPHAVLLLVDDADRLWSSPELAEDLAGMLDWALNLGVQVVLTADATPPVAARSIREMVQQGLEVRLDAPDRVSLMLFLRQRADAQGLVLTDDQLAVLLERDPVGWREASAALARVSLAVEEGEVPRNVADIRRLMGGQSLDPEPVEQMQEADVRSWVSDMVDRHLPAPLDVDVDIHERATGLPDVDDYVPPDLSPGTARAADSDVVETLMTTARAAATGRLEDADSLRERSAASEKRMREEADRWGASLEHIDRRAEAGFKALEDELHEHEDHLVAVQTEMEAILARLDDAEGEELLELADRMMTLEVELDQMGASTMESTPTADTPPLVELSEFDEHTPDGDWDIDADDVAVEELLDPDTTTASEDAPPQPTAGGKRRRKRRKVRRRTAGTDEGDDAAPEINVAPARPPASEDAADDTVVEAPDSVDTEPSSLDDEDHAERTSEHDPSASPPSDAGHEKAAPAPAPAAIKRPVAQLRPVATADRPTSDQEPRAVLAPRAQLKPVLAPAKGAKAPGDVAPSESPSGAPSAAAPKDDPAEQPDDDEAQAPSEAATGDDA